MHGGFYTNSMILTEKTLMGGHPGNNAATAVDLGGRESDRPPSSQPKAQTTHPKTTGLLYELGGHPRWRCTAMAVNLDASAMGAK